MLILSSAPPVVSFPQDTDMFLGLRRKSSKACTKVSLLLSLTCVIAPSSLLPLTLSLIRVNHTSQNLAAETAAYLTTKHPDYAILAARIAVSNLHKETKKNFSHVVKDLYDYGL